MKYTVATIVLLASPLLSAPPPRLVREIDLNRTVAAVPDFAPFAILAFSPDENWLAVAVGATQVGHHDTHRNVDLRPAESLLLVPLDGNARQPVKIDPDLRPGGKPAWSPDSSMVLVEGFDNGPLVQPGDAIAKLWDLRGDELLRRRGQGLVVGTTVDTPIGGIFGFLDTRHLLARRMPAKGMPAVFETLDLQGQVVDMWTVPKHWEVADISPARGLLAILTDQASKTLVVDRQSKKVILARANPFGFLGYAEASLHGHGQYFTESGKTLCSVGSVGTGNPQFDVPTECWDVDSGRKIAQFHGFRGGAPAAASSDNSRLVLSHELAFPKRDGALVFPRGERVVWDFCSGTEIAAWKVPQIANSSHILDRVAISSSGRYVAETAGTLLRIYKLP